MRNWGVTISIAFCTFLMYGCARTESPRKVPILLAPTGDYLHGGLGPLHVLDSHTVDNVDSLLKQTSMAPHMHSLVPCETVVTSKFRNAILKSFPGYEIVCAAAISSDLRVQHAEQEKYIQMIAQSGTPTSYARVYGQKSGEVGIMYVNAGLGPPRADFTPPSILFESWDRLRTVLDAHDGVDWSKIIGIDVGQRQYGSSYKVTGFDLRSVPEWARRRLGFPNEK